MTFDARRGFALNLLVFLALGILSGTASAAPAIALSASSGPGGMTVSAVSTGFDPDHVGYNTGFYATNDNVHFQLLGVCPGPIGDTTRANCTIPIRMPSPMGLWSIVAFNSNREFAATSFSVLTPSLDISPTCGPAGASIVVTGERWALDFDAGIYLDGSLVRAGNFPLAGGVFSQTIAGPTSPDGPHSVHVFNSDGQSLAISFTTPLCADIGTVVDVQGTALVTHADGTSGPLANGDHVRQDDTITVGLPGTVKILLNDSTELTLSAGASLRLNEYQFDSGTDTGNAFTRALAGSFEYLSGLMNHTQNPDNQQIDLVYGAIGIRGTNFIAQLGQSGAEVDLISGGLDVSPYGTIDTTAFAGPIKIFLNSQGTTTSPLTQEEYDAIKAALFGSASSDLTPPQVTVAFAAAPAGQSGFFNAAQTPVPGSVSASDDSNVTAIACHDSLSGLSVGAPTGLNAGTAGETLSLSGDGSHVVSCGGTDGAGNSGAAIGSLNSATVNIDATAPSIVYSGNQGAYTVDQTVAITCVASDALSGLASSTCQNVGGAAYSFNLGPNTFSAGAFDKAGNQGTGSAQFTVSVTYGSLANLVNAFEANSGVAANLVSTLQSSQAAASQGNAKAANNQLNSFINQVKAQSGKSMTSDQAAILIRLATALRS